jgi:glycosyl transferase family 25
MARHIVVINLDRDVDRMAHMHAQLARCGVQYQRFRALQGDRLTSDLARYFPFGTPLSPGEIGCYASHLAIMQAVARGDMPTPTLVLEDDVGLPDDLSPVFDALIGALPAQWDIVRLSYHTKSVSRPVARIDGERRLVRYTRVPTTTGAYLISASGARKFLEHRPRRLPIDHDLRRVWEWSLDTYGVSPPLVRHGVLDTSSIDQLSPAGRARLRRKLVTPTRPLARIRQSLRDFGLQRWIAAGMLNAAARLTPKPMRTAFVQWANARLS